MRNFTFEQLNKLIDDFDEEIREMQKEEMLVFMDDFSVPEINTWDDQPTLETTKLEEQALDVDVIDYSLATKMIEYNLIQLIWIKQECHHQQIFGQKLPAALPRGQLPRNQPHQIELVHKTRSAGAEKKEHPQRDARCNAMLSNAPILPVLSKVLKEEGFSCRLKRLFHLFISYL